MQRERKLQSYIFFSIAFEDFNSVADAKNLPSFSNSGPSLVGTNSKGCLPL